MTPTTATRKVVRKASKSTQRRVERGMAKAVRSATTSPARGRSGAAKSARPDPRSLGQGTWFQLRFTGLAGSRAYRVYKPKGLRRTTRAPVLLALHGCTQDGLDFAAGTRFNQLADTHGFLVVYPDQPVTHHAQRCWNWFRAGHQLRGAGEPAVLAGIVRDVGLETARWRVDPTRVYVVGISAGGGMALVLAATYPELFAAVGVHSAPPYRSATGPADAVAAMQGAGPPQLPAPAAPLPPTIIFQGTADGTVRSANAERIADQWLRARESSGTAPPVGKGRQTRTSAPPSGTGRGPRSHRVTRWSAGGRVVLELWVVEGLGHAWSGGSSKGSYSDARGPRASTKMWGFLSKHTAAKPT